LSDGDFDALDLSVSFGETGEVDGTVETAVFDGGEELDGRWHLGDCHEKSLDGDAVVAVTGTEDERQGAIGESQRFEAVLPGFLALCRAPSFAVVKRDFNDGDFVFLEGLSIEVGLLGGGRGVGGRGV